MSITGRISSLIAPRAGRVAPRTTSAVVHRALAGAISGVGPLKGAAAAAEQQLKQAGDGPGAVDEAIGDLIANHVRMAGVQGFVTNIGGLITLAATVPANIAGLALLQCRMIAGIAHLRGYDLSDPRVQNAVLTCMLGKDEVARMVKKNKLPGSPHEIAMSGTRISDLDRIVGVQVATSLIGRVAGRKLATSVGKRVPVIGGVVGAGTDAWSTRAVGRYAATELVAVSGT